MLKGAIELQPKDQVKFASGLKTIDALEFLTVMGAQMIKIWFTDLTTMEVSHREIFDVKLPDVTVTLTNEEAEYVFDAMRQMEGMDLDAAGHSGPIRDKLKEANMKAASPVNGGLI